jgi:hypothetical protein
MLWKNCYDTIWQRYKSSFTIKKISVVLTVQFPMALQVTFTVLPYIQDSLKEHSIHGPPSLKHSTSDGHSDFPTLLCFCDWPWRGSFTISSFDFEWFTPYRTTNSTMNMTERIFTLMQRMTLINNHMLHVRSVIRLKNAHNKYPCLSLEHITNKRSKPQINKNRKQR